MSPGVTTFKQKFVGCGLGVALAIIEDDGSMVELGTELSMLEDDETIDELWTGVGVDDGC